MNWLESTIAFVSPQLALERSQAREKIHYFGYDGAYPGLARGWSGGISKNAPSETIRAQTDRVRLIWDARDMERQFGLMVGILDRMEQYVCPKIKYQAQTGDKETDREYQEFFHEWCLNCDYTERFTFQEMVGLGLRGMLRDGDYGFIKRFTGRELRLEHVEGDRIGNPLQIGDPNERYISGVGIGDRGQPDFFRIFHRTRTGQYDQPEDIPSNRFIHLYKPIRSDQYRGFSWFAAALPLIRDLYEIFRCERGAAKWASGIAAKRTSIDPSYGKGPLGWDGQTYLGAGTDTLQPDKIVNVTPGYDIEAFPGSNRPSGAFMAHVQAIIREISISLNLPYGFVYDMSGFGAASARLETAQTQRSIQRFQGLLENRMLRDVKNDVLALGIARGDLRPNKNWKKGMFGYGPFITADYGYQTTADLQLVAAGLKSAHKVAHECGEEFEELVETVAGETETWYHAAIAKQLPLELINKTMTGATNLLATMNGPSAEDQAAEAAAQPPPTLLQKIGDKGAMLILQTMEQVGQGVIPHEDGVAFLVNLLGLDRAIVEQFIPPTGEKETPQPPAAAAPKPVPKRAK
jgi:capsid protein